MKLLLSEHKPRRSKHDGNLLLHLAYKCRPLVALGLNSLYWVQLTFLMSNISSPIFKLLHLFPVSYGGENSGCSVNHQACWGCRYFWRETQCQSSEICGPNPDVPRIFRNELRLLNDGRTCGNSSRNYSNVSSRYGSCSCSSTSISSTSSSSRSTSGGDIIGIPQAYAIYIIAKSYLFDEPQKF